MTDHEITMGLASTFVMFARELARQGHVDVHAMVQMLDRLTDASARPFANNLAAALQLPPDAPAPSFPPFTVIQGDRK